MADNNSESILLSVKKLRNVAADDDSFDVDIIQDINTAFSILNQLGVGPEDGFAIEGADEVWNDFIPDDLKSLRMARSYVEKQVQLMFDPPASAAHLQALKETLAMLESRLNWECEPYDLLSEKGGNQNGNLY